MYGKIKSCLPRLKGVSVFVTILRTILYCMHVTCSHTFIQLLLYTALMRSTIISIVYTTYCCSPCMCCMVDIRHETHFIIQYVRNHCDVRSVFIT